MASYPTGPKGAIQSSFTGSLEKNNHKQGRSGSGTMKKPGPATGKTLGTASNSGGINRATQPKV